MPVAVWAHLAATLYLCGLIWVIQLVHYPLMSRISGDAFVAYHAEHTRRISAVVVAPMVVELATALVLLLNRPPGVPLALMVAGAVLVAVVWMSTFVLQVPQHRILARGFDLAAHRRLVQSNWIRTVAWTLRSPIAVAIAIAAFR
jgi:hypothetical protein